MRRAPVYKPEDKHVFRHLEFDLKLLDLPIDALTSFRDEHEYLGMQRS